MNRRRNPANVPRLSYHPPAPLVPLHGDTMSAEWYRRKSEWDRALTGEWDRVNAEYLAIFGEILRGMLVRSWEARQKHVFEPPHTPADAKRLPLYLAAQARDTMAGAVIANVVHAKLWMDDQRIKSGSHTFTFDELLAYEEQVAVQVEALAAAKGAYDARRERFGALFGLGGDAPQRFAAIQRDQLTLEGFLTQAQAALAGGNYVKAAGRLNAARIELATMAEVSGWSDAAKLITHPNLTKLRGAVARMKRLADKGDPPLRPSLAQLEEAAREDELNAEGARELARQRKLEATRQARTEKERAALKALYDQTQESLSAYEQHNVLVVRWTHPDPINPAFVRHERLEVHPPIWTGSRLGRLEYDARTVAPSGKLGRERILRRVLAEVSYENRGNDEPAYQGDHRVRGVKTELEREAVYRRMDAMFRRAREVYAARGNARPVPAPTVFQNPSRRRR